MEPLRHAASNALQMLLDGQPTTAGKVTFAWTIAAGPIVSRAGAPQWSENGTLRVRARDAAWRLEIRHARPVIAERLDRLLGPGVIRRIVIE